MQSGRSSTKLSEERATSIIDLTSTRLLRFKTNLSSLPRYGISRFVWYSWKFYTRLHGVTSHYVTIRQRHENVESHHNKCDFYPFNNFLTEILNGSAASGPNLCLRWALIMQATYCTVLLPNAYTQTTPCPKKWLACWGTLQRQAVVWLMHKAGFGPQRVAVRYAASTDTDVLRTFTLYQTSLGFDS